MHDIAFSGIDFTARTITYEGNTHTVRHTTYEGPTAHGTLHTPDGTVLPFDTPLTTHERDMLVSLLTRIGERVRPTMTAATGTTMQLHMMCRACGTPLPGDALFCIACRAPVHL